MHQSVLMNADIDKRPEFCDVRHDAFQHHAGLQIGNLADFILELRSNKPIPRIATWLAQFFYDVVEGVDAGRQSFALDLAHGS